VSAKIIRFPHRPEPGILSDPARCFGDDFGLPRTYGCASSSGLRSGLSIYGPGGRLRRWARTGYRGASEHAVSVNVGTTPIPFPTVGWSRTTPPKLGAS
jgi:hypothetical protein